MFKGSGTETGFDGDASYLVKSTEGLEAAITTGVNSSGFFS